MPYSTATGGLKQSNAIWISGMLLMFSWMTVDGARANLGIEY